MSQRSRSKAKTLHLFQRTIRRALQRPEELTVSEWAEKYRVLDESSNISGKWSNSITPYLVGIMDSINDPHIREIYFCKSSQVGGTEALINILGYLIMEEPAPAMIVYPSDDLAKDISNDKLKPAFRLIPQIRKIFYENSSKELRIFNMILLQMQKRCINIFVRSEKMKINIICFLMKLIKWAVLLKKRHRLLIWQWNELKLTNPKARYTPVQPLHCPPIIFGLFMTMQMRSGIILSPVLIVGK